MIDDAHDEYSALRRKTRTLVRESVQLAHHVHLRRTAPTGVLV